MVCLWKCSDNCRAIRYFLDDMYNKYYGGIWVGFLLCCTSATQARTLRAQLGRVLLQFPKYPRIFARFETFKNSQIFARFATIKYPRIFARFATFKYPRIYARFTVFENILGYLPGLKLLVSFLPLKKQFSSLASVLFSQANIGFHRQPSP